MEPDQSLDRSETGNGRNAEKMECARTKNEMNGQVEQEYTVLRKLTQNNRQKDHFNDNIKDNYPVFCAQYTRLPIVLFGMLGRRALALSISVLFILFSKPFFLSISVVSLVPVHSVQCNIATCSTLSIHFVWWKCSVTAAAWWKLRSDRMRLFWTAHWPVDWFRCMFVASIQFSISLLSVRITIVTVRLRTNSIIWIGFLATELRMLDNFVW